MSQKLEYELKGKSDVEQVTGRAKKSVESLGDSFKKAGDDIVKRLTGMFAGAVLFDKAINFITTSFRNLDQVADQVDRSGLSAEKFQQLAWAAQMTGVQMSVLAKATRQLRVDMAEAANGTGKKVEMFKALGITMDQLKSGDATAVFLAISAAMEGGADDSERLLITTALFGDKIGNDIMPMLADFQKLQKDIADAPIVDAKTLKAIGDFNDGMDRANAGAVRLGASIFRLYDGYSKLVSKIAEGVATFGFNVADFMMPESMKGTHSKIASGILSTMPQTAALVAAGADGATTPSGGPRVPAGSSDRTKALLAAIGGVAKSEKEKSADTKGAAGGNAASSVSGNVIGVGQNPVIAALQDQTEIAKQSMTYLEMIAYNFGPQNKFRDITDKGATPITPATR
jgi:hypothetical protein